MQKVLGELQHKEIFLLQQGGPGRVETSVNFEKIQVFGKTPWI